MYICLFNKYNIWMYLRSYWRIVYLEINKLKKIVWVVLKFYIRWNNFFVINCSLLRGRFIYFGMKIVYFILCLKKISFFKVD